MVCRNPLLKAERARKRNPDSIAREAALDGRERPALEIRALGWLGLQRFAPKAPMIPSLLNDPTTS